MTGEILKIALTGGAASGKSSVCKLFEVYGMKLIQLDLLAREVVMPGQKAYRELVKRFGATAVNRDGSLDRAYLRERMTSDPEAKTFLEEIVQPEIIRLMHQRIELFRKAGERFVVVEVPLLFETGMESMFDVSILVTVDPDVQVERLMVRDGVDRDGATALLNLQMTQQEKMKRADIIIENKGSLGELDVSVNRLVKKLIENQSLYVKSS